MAISQQREFLSQIPPFDSLPEKRLNELADSMDVVYLPEGMELPNDTNHIYILIKGKVSEHQAGDVISHYRVRGFFGESGIIGKTEQPVYFWVDEEAVAYKLSAKQFLNAFENNREFADFFNSSIVDKLNRIHEALQTASSTEVMMDTVCNAHIQQLVEIDEAASILQATQKMMQARTDACLVHFQEGESGIVTATDVLKQVASGDLEAISQSGSLVSIANRPVYSVHEYDYLFNALLKMTRFQIDRLAVRSDKGFVGFLHQKDLMSLFANQSGLVLTRVEKAQNLEDLAAIGPQVDQLIKSLNHKGIKTHYIAKLVNELHRKMIVKLVDILLPCHLQDKICLIVMGSEGRSEQVIRTDQDNALIYANDLSEDEAEDLTGFAQKFIEAMQTMGFPLCPGNIMLSNRQWRMSQAEFSQKVSQWFEKASEEDFMNAAIFFDAETVYGQDEWLFSLKQILQVQKDKYANFLRHFAIQSLKFNTPVGFFGGLISDSESGDEVIDIKKGGIFSIVHGIRCYALEQGVKATNTHWRIKELMDKGIFEKDFGIELGETLNFLNSLRLESMLHQLAAGKAFPDNKIRLSELTHMQQDLLKQSFAVVESFKKRLTHHFGLHGML